MKRFLPAILASSTLAIGLCTSAFASPLDDAVAVYRAGRFTESMVAFKAIIAKQPDSLEARYYLANAYASLGDIENARKQYWYCAKAAPGTKMEEYCLKALGMPKASAATSAGVKNPEKELQKVAEQKMDLQAQEYVANLEKQRNTELKNLNNKTNSQADTINRQTNMDIDNVPKYIYVGSRSYRNPYYNDEVSRLRADATQRIADLKDRMTQDAESINERFDKKAEEIKESHQGMRTALQSAKGNMQLTPHGTHMYVRNYINFGQETVYEPPVSLQARPLSINDKPPELSRAEKIKLLRKQMILPYSDELK